MKGKILIWILVAVFSIAGTASGADPVRALFIYWRGETECGQGLKEGLREMGYTLELTEFDAAQDIAKLDQFLNTLDPQPFRFIYTFGTTASLRAAEKIQDVPILFGIVTNPVKSGLINGWKSSENNVTGVSHAISYEDQFALIQKIGPYRRIGILYNPKEQNSLIALKELGDLFTADGVKVINQPVDSPEAVGSAVAALADQQPELVYLPSDSFIVSHVGTILPALNARKIPTYGALEQMVEAGALIGIVSSYSAVGKNLAQMADQVLKGKKPAEIPSRTLPFDMQTIVINANTLEAIGAQIPFAIMDIAKLKH
ncbi:MAG: ABC transporter substrate-binding protein [Thermodesulfobacteriota bacterium]